MEAVSGGEPAPDHALVERALAINFSLPGAGTRHLPFVWLVLGTFTRARDVIAASDRFFFDATAEEAGAFFPPERLPPAYALFDRGVYFTPAFAPFASGRGFGPMCRAAMVVHESVHVIDRVSGEPEVHVSEWDEPAFSAQTAEQSLHNPSSYASFAAQVHAGALAWPRDVRFGAGRPAE